MRSTSSVMTASHGTPRVTHTAVGHAWAPRGHRGHPRLQNNTTKKPILHKVGHDAHRRHPSTQTHTRRRHTFRISAPVSRRTRSNRCDRVLVPPCGRSLLLVERDELLRAPARRGRVEVGGRLGPLELESGFGVLVARRHAVAEKRVEHLGEVVAVARDGRHGRRVGERVVGGAQLEDLAVRRQLAVQQEAVFGHGHRGERRGRVARDDLLGEGDRRVGRRGLEDAAHDHALLAVRVNQRPVLLGQPALHRVLLEAARRHRGRC
mmetsp:Transcript_16704/g.67379  ORF Transcript_16704/g.67379 Transcript_16704/m.67379 type:complete len:264 (-) Transcript_16704:34-825(-)